MRLVRLEAGVMLPVTELPVLLSEDLVFVIVAVLDAETAILEDETTLLPDELVAAGVAVTVLVTVIGPEHPLGDVELAKAEVPLVVPGMVDEATLVVRAGAMPVVERTLVSGAVVLGEVRVAVAEAVKVVLLKKTRVSNGTVVVMVWEGTSSMGAATETPSSSSTTTRVLYLPTMTDGFAVALSESDESGTAGC